MTVRLEQAPPSRCGCFGFVSIRRSISNNIAPSPGRATEFSLALPVLSFMPIYTRGLLCSPPAVLLSPLGVFLIPPAPRVEPSLMLWYCSTGLDNFNKNQPTNSCNFHQIEQRVAIESARNNRDWGVSRIYEF